MPTRNLQLGSDVVNNGTFASDTAWTKGDGWTISDNNASSDGTQAAVSLLTNTGTVVSGSRYRCKFTVSGHSVGTVRFRLGSVSGVTRSEDGDYMEVIKANGTDIILRANDTFVGNVDDVIVEKVT